MSYHITVCRGSEQGHWSWTDLDSGSHSATHWLCDLEQVKVSGLTFPDV